VANLLLVEEGWSQTLEVARGLEDAGHAVTVVTANGSTASYRRRSVEWRSGPLVSSELVAHLEQLVASQRFDRIVPLTESVMRRLWDAGWHDRIFPPTLPWQRALIADKHRMLEHLGACGIDVPRQLRIGDDFDAVETARTLGLPVVVKDAIGVAGTRVAIAETPRELASLVDRTRACGGAWIAQEYVRGPTCLFGGVFHAGRALRIYAGEKLELHPPRVGPAIRMRSDEHDALAEVGSRAIAELAWTGFASADFIRRGDGRHVLLEINPRPWGSIAAAREAGVDLVGAFAALVAGAVPEPDLHFARNHETMIFPRYLLAPRYRSLDGAMRVLRDLCSEQGRDWRHPGFLRHIVHRLRRVRLTLGSW
jgi:hypothetical protein